MQAAPEQSVTTVGATHALDIVSRTFLRAGDYVMVEEPGWAIEFARLDAMGMRILPVPRRGVVCFCVKIVLETLMALPEVLFQGETHQTVCCRS